MVEGNQGIPGLAVGRIVHYVLPEGRSKGEHRPAIVVRVWDKYMGCVNLQVFTDGSNDGAEHGLLWATSSLYSEEPKEWTWHYPERE